MTDQAEAQTTRQKLAWRLGCMADAILSAKVGPQSRFFSRERVDQIVLALREAEKALLDSEQERRILSAARPRPAEEVCGHSVSERETDASVECSLPLGHAGSHDYSEPAARPRPVEDDGLMTIFMDGIAERVHNNGRLSVLTWARERLDNTLRLAATKTGADREGWLEDAAYWREIVALIQPVRPRPETEPDFEKVLTAGIQELVMMLGARVPPRNEAWGTWAERELEAFVRSLLSLARPRPEEEKEPDVHLLAWAVSNCHTLARRRLRALERLGDTQPLTFLNQEREFWQHVQRICEKAGARSAGVLRASLPTEITDGSASRPRGPEPQPCSCEIDAFDYKCPVHGPEPQTEEGKQWVSSQK